MLKNIFLQVYNAMIVKIILNTISIYKILSKVSFSNVFLFRLLYMWKFYHELCILIDLTLCYEHMFYIVDLCLYLDNFRIFFLNKSNML